MTYKILFFKNQTQLGTLAQKGVRVNHSHIQLPSLRSVRSRLPAPLLNSKQVDRKSSRTRSEQAPQVKITSSHLTMLLRINSLIPH
uniref:Uncharacterized protein n=1 Tax=Ligilactobacillus acidipiscis TaxID=89059 RepID=A0A2R8FGC5_9LACO|nr:hypothetical protein PLAC02_P67 [Ligilactobacillus acidipiscis]